MSVGRLDEAESLLLKGQEKLPEDHNLKITLAWVANRRGNWQTAKVRWEALKAILPNNNQVSLGLIETYSALGHLDNASAMAASLRNKGIDDQFLKNLEDRIATAENSAE
jgi:thioredoxin-like negative regulator of GroEL